MRAVVLESYGGPEVLTIREVPDPGPGPEEVVVAVTGTAVNRADVLQRMGFYPEPGPPRPFEVPGLELAGRVERTGERCTLWSEGDEVMAIVAGGGYAEKAVVHERQLIAVPPTVGLADAAAIPEVWITAWDALVRQGGLRPGGAVLVQAGGSGVGSAAIQLAKAMHATVVTTASTGKVDACRSFGADAVVDYRKGEDLVAACKEATGGRGVDVVVDVVGGDELARNVASLAVGGTIVQVGVMSGGKAQIDLGALLPKRATIRGTVLRARPLEEKIAVSRQFAREVIPLFEARAVRPVIDSRYALDDVAGAHGRMQDNANIGKILLDVAPPATKA